MKVNTANSWAGGAQLDVIITNNGDKPVCSVTVKAQKDASTSFVSMWNLESKDGGATYTTPTWTNLAKGQSLSAGVVVNGKSPSFSVVSSKTC